MSREVVKIAIREGLSEQSLRYRRGPKGIGAINLQPPILANAMSAKDIGTVR